MIRVVKVIFILVIFNLSMCNHAIAGACTGSWGKDIKLADNLKTILVEEIPVPIKSSDFSEGEVFKNMIISYEKKSGETVETGNKPDLPSLQGATGYATVDFTLNSDFSEIPVIKDYLEREHLSTMDSIKISDVKAKIIFKDENNNEVLSYDFWLKKDRNTYPICELGKTNKVVKSIDIKVVSFNSNFSLSHTFTNQDA